MTLAPDFTVWASIQEARYIAGMVNDPALMVKLAQIETEAVGEAPGAGDGKSGAISADWHLKFRRRIDALIEPTFPKLRFLDSPCITKEHAYAEPTGYVFTDYDLYKLAMGWITIDELKKYEWSDGAPEKDIQGRTGTAANHVPGPSPDFKRYQPIDWKREEQVELTFLAMLALFANKGDTANMVSLMSKMIVYKRKAKDQWITLVPGFLEVAQSRRLANPVPGFTTPNPYISGIGFAPYNGRYRYAVCRCGGKPYNPEIPYNAETNTPVTGREALYMYVTTGELADRFKGDSGLYNFDENAGKWYYEINFPGREKITWIKEGDLYYMEKDGKPDKSIPGLSQDAAVNLGAWMKRPLDLLTPPLTLEQQLMAGLHSAAVAITYFVSMVVSLMTMGGDTILKQAVGMLVSAVSGQDATPGQVDQMVTTVSAGESVFYTDRAKYENQNLSDILSKLVFDDADGSFAKSIAGAVPKYLPLFETRPIETTGTVAPKVFVSRGWAARLFRR